MQESAVDKPKHLVGNSLQIRKIREQIQALSGYHNVITLFTGETGTGKEEAARFLHKRTRGYEKNSTLPFVVADLSRIPQNMVERELFGNDSGAYTDANRQKPGLIDEAADGTLLFDEIGEANDYVQQRLLRLMDEREYLRLGSSKPLKCLARIVVASRIDLAQAVAEKKFREDLYWRICDFTITMPPLRQRVGDISILAEHFLQQFAAAQNVPKMSVGESVTNWLQNREWPGNVRQLNKALTGAVIRASMQGRQTLCTEDFEVLESRAKTTTDSPLAYLLPETDEHKSFKQTVTEVMDKVRLDIERLVLLDRLRKCGWNRTQAAAKLGFSIKGLRAKIKEYKLEES